MSKLQLFHGRLWKCICFHLFPLPFQWHSNYNFNSSVKKIFWQQRKTLMMIEICLSSPSPLALLFCKPPGLLFFISFFFCSICYEVPSPSEPWAEWAPEQRDGAVPPRWGQPHTHIPFLCHHFVTALKSSKWWLLFLCRVWFCTGSMCKV